MKSKKLYCLLSGAFCGFLNGFFGAGGGTVAVPMLRRAGLSEKEAHATSIAVILAVTLVSAAFYLWRGDVRISDSYGFIGAGLLGAAVGAGLLKKLSGPLLRRIFGIIIVIASVRMLLK